MRNRKFWLILSIVILVIDVASILIFFGGPIAGGVFATVGLHVVSGLLATVTTIYNVIRWVISIVYAVGPFAQDLVVIGQVIVGIWSRAFRKKTVEQEKVMKGDNAARSQPQEISSKEEKEIEQYIDRLKASYQKEVDPGRYVPPHIFPMNNQQGLQSGGKSISSDPEALMRLDQQRLEYNISNQKGLPFESARESQLLNIVLGGPGSGKTLFLKWLAWKIFTNPDDEILGVLRGRNLPIYVDLQELGAYLRKRKPAGATLLDYIAGTWRENGCGVSKEVIVRYIKREMGWGNVLFLLDEIDKVRKGSMEDAEDVFRKIRDSIHFHCTNDPKGSPTIITKRFYNENETIPDSYAIGVIEDLQTEDIHAAIKRLDNRITLENTIRLQSFASIPLALNTLKDQFKMLTLPRQRSDMYKEYENRFLERSVSIASNVFSSGKSDSQEKLGLLAEYLAWGLHKEKRIEYSEVDLENKIRDFLGTCPLPQSKRKKADTADPAKVVLPEVIQRDGLLRKDVEKSDSYRFASIVLQEYYTARYIYHHYTSWCESIDISDPW
jgi:hypothetical protein